MCGSEIGNVEFFVLFVCLIHCPEKTLVSAISHWELLGMTKLFGTKMVRGLRSAVNAWISSLWTE